MSEPITFPHSAIRAAYLKLAPPDDVFRWLAESKPNTERSSYEKLLDPNAILQLLERGESLIDLGIASFVDEPDALATLWTGGDRAIRLAIAANTTRKGFAGLHKADLEELCGGGDQDLCKLVFSNPSMSHAGLANVIERKEGFDRLSESSWRKALYFAIRNPILHKPIEEATFSDDGFEMYQQSLPFRAVWSLLLLFDATDANAALLSDAFLNIVDFDPPYDHPSLGLPPAPPRAPEFSIDELASFSSTLEQGTRMFVEKMLAKWKEKPGPEEERSVGEWEFPSDRGFIRQGIAAGASRRSYSRELIAYLRDHPDKWVRAGYYGAFAFSTADAVKAAYDRDETFFSEQAVYNPALYKNTPGGWTFRGLVGLRSGRDWKEFSNDQMRRSVFYHRALALWKQDAGTYPHPEDDIDSFSLVPSKREPGESIADYLDRRSEEMRGQTDARLAQIRRWLDGSSGEPTRVWPVVASMIATLQQEIEVRLAMLAEVQVPPKAGRSGLFGRG